MKTFVLFAKPGLLHWLEPVRMLWYAAERDGRVEFVDAEGLEVSDLRARLWSALAGSPNVKWRVVLVVDEDDARLSDPRLDMAEALGADRRACQLLVFERTVNAQEFLVGGGENQATTVRGRFPEAEEPTAATVVRVLDFMAEDRLESRLDAANTLLALATLDAAGDGRVLEAFRGEFHLNNVGPRLGPGPSNGLPGGLRYTRNQSSLATILDAYVGRLRGAHAALKAPTVPVALFGEGARAEVERIVKERIDEIPQDLEGFWFEFGDVAHMSSRDAHDKAATTPRLQPPLPGGFWRREDWGRWLSWRERFDRGIAELWDRMHSQARDAHEAGLASLRAAAPRPMDATEDPIEHHPPKVRTLGLDEVRSELARLEKALRERSTVPDASGAGPPEPDWQGRAATLAGALAFRPTRRQVLVSATIGVLSVMPAALLQVSVLSRVVSLAAIVALVGGVVLWVRGTSRCWPHEASVLCRIARAIEGIRTTAASRLEPLRTRRGRLVKVLITQLEAFADEQDVQSLREALARLELDHARYLYHLRMLTLHAERAEGLRDAIWRSASEGPVVDAAGDDVAVPDLMTPVHLEPTYALDGDRVEANEPQPQFDAAEVAGVVPLEPRYFPGFERIRFSRCRPVASQGETDAAGNG